MSKSKLDLEFKRGVVLCCCTLAVSHNYSNLAAELLEKFDISENDINRMDLADFDLLAMEEIHRARRPYGDVS